MFGGWVGQRCLVAGMETFSLVLLWLAVPVGIMVATDWLFAGYIYRFLGGSMVLADVQRALSISAPEKKKKEEPPPGRVSGPRPSSPRMAPRRPLFPPASGTPVKKEQEPEKAAQTPPQTPAARPLGGGPWRPAEAPSVKPDSSAKNVVPLVSPADPPVWESGVPDDEPSAPVGVISEQPELPEEESVPGVGTTPSDEETRSIPWWKQESLLQEDAAGSVGSSEETASGTMTAEAPEEVLPDSASEYSSEALEADPETETEETEPVVEEEAEAEAEAAAEEETAEEAEPALEEEAEAEVETELETELEPAGEMESEPESELVEEEADEQEAERSAEDEAEEEAPADETILEPEPQAAFPFDHEEEEAPSQVSIEDEALFRDAVAVVLAEQKGSIAVLQKELSLGYFAASKLLNALEGRGIIAPHAGSIARKVIVTEEEAAKIIGEETP